MASLHGCKCLQNGPIAPHPPERPPCRHLRPPPGRKSAVNSGPFCLTPAQAQRRSPWAPPQGVGSVRGPTAARDLEYWAPMSEPKPADTDAFLLNLEEHEFIRVGAMLGLRARPATTHDVALVDQFLDTDGLFGSRRPVLVTSTPNLPPQ